MDKTDIKILKTMSEHGTVSPNDINERTEIPKSTIYYRLNKLKDAGVIRSEIFDLDKQKAGFDITVISEVMAAFGEGYHEKVGEKLAEIEGVSHVYFMMGDTDFIVISRLPSRDMIETLVEEFEAIDGIQRTSSKFVISTIKADESVGILSDYSESTILNSHGINEPENENE